MILIGEKINGTRAQIKEAILARDADLIAQIAKEQAEAGADYLDVNAGTEPDRELDDMLWLMEVVQDVVDVPLCIDSSSGKTLDAAVGHARQTPMVNSINADPARLEAFIPIISKGDYPVIALALDESKAAMPKDSKERLDNIARIVKATRSAGIGDDKLFIDPLIMSVSTDQRAAAEVLECMKAIRETYPEAHITGGLSNISFGLPERALVNRTFLVLAMEAGMDSAVCNPADTSFIGSLKAADMLLGNDRFCRGFTKAAKKGFTSK